MMHESAARWQTTGCDKEGRMGQRDRERPEQQQLAFRATCSHYETKVLIECKEFIRTSDLIGSHKESSINLIGCP